jgi:hypothetical protein
MDSIFENFNQPTSLDLYNTNESKILEALSKAFGREIISINIRTKDQIYFSKKNPKKLCLIFRIGDKREYVVAFDYDKLSINQDSIQLARLT